MIPTHQFHFLSSDCELGHGRAGLRGTYFWPVLLALLASALMTCATLLVIWLEVKFNVPF